MKTLAIFCVACCLALCARPSVAQTSDPGRYIRPDGPSLKLKSYDGERYSTMAPDTLDIAERSKLTLAGLTNILDPMMITCSTGWSISRTSRRS